MSKDDMAAQGPLDRGVSRLPPGFVENGMRLAEDCTLFGVPLTSLSRDELLAAAAEGWQAYNRHLQQSIESSRLIRELHAAARHAG